MQKPYLPTAREIDEMSRLQFSEWMCEAQQELSRRAEERDPLLYAKKRISNILSNITLTENQREAQVLGEIERYVRTTSKRQ